MGLEVWPVWGGGWNGEGWYREGDLSSEYVGERLLWGHEFDLRPIGRPQVGWPVQHCILVALGEDDVGEGMLFHK